MRVLKDFVKWFLYITMGILIVCAVNFQIADAESIPKETLWQILLSGFLTTGITVLLYPRNGSNKSTFWVEILAHYLALCIIMILCGYWFGWLDFDATPRSDNQRDGENDAEEKKIGVFRDFVCIPDGISKCGGIRGAASAAFGCGSRSAGGENRFLCSGA